MLKAAGQPVNLTGYTILASIYRDERRSEKLADLDVIYVNRALGSLMLRLDRSITRTITTNGYWDMLVIEPSDDADYWLEGPALLNVGLTDST